MSNDQNKEQNHLLGDIVNGTINSELVLPYSLETVPSGDQISTEDSDLDSIKRDGLPNDIKKDDPPQSLSVSNQPVDQAMYARMESELIKSRELIVHLKSEVSQLKKKCVDLENRLATGKYPRYV